MNCREGQMDRRSFLAATAVAGLGLTIGTEAIGQALPSREWKALDDPDIIHHTTGFKSGDTEIAAYVARPKKGGRYPAVVLLHGNPGITDDVRLATDPGFNFCPAEAELARQRMIRFLTTHLKP